MVFCSRVFMWLLNSKIHICELCMELNTFRIVVMASPVFAYLSSSPKPLLLMNVGFFYQFTPVSVLGNSYPHSFLDFFLFQKTLVFFLIHGQSLHCWVLLIWHLHSRSLVSQTPTSSHYLSFCDVHFETNLFRRNLQLLHHFPQLLYITAYQQDVVNGVKIISMWSIDNNDLKMFSSARVNNLGDMVSPWSTSRSICIFSVSRFLLILTWNVVFWYIFTVLASKVYKIAHVSIESKLHESLWMPNEKRCCIQ